MASLPPSLHLPQTPISASAQPLLDRSAPSRLNVGAGAQQTDTARQHLVAVRDGEVVRAKVSPQRVKPTSHMYSIRVSGSAVEFDLDIQPGLGIYKDDSGPDTTAYGLLADMINALRGV